MIKEIDVLKLNALRKNFEEYDKAKKEIDRLNNEILKLEKEPLTEVKKYDSENKSKYIKAKIGEKPVEPSKLVMLAIPLYIKKKNEYDVALKKYQDDYKVAETEYYDEHRSRRKELDAKDRVNRKNAIDKLKKTKQKITEKCSEYKKNIDDEKILGGNIKTYENVCKILGYISDGRVDSIKEAVNLLFEEKHREKIEEFCKKQVEYTKQAAESAAKALGIAEEALETANAAMEYAEEAIDKVNEIPGNE